MTSRSTTNNLFMIALYYWYIDIPTEFLDDQVSFHQSLCTKLNLFGRIRISPEGLNGVLSGKRKDLLDYEEQIKHEIELKFRCRPDDDDHNYNDDIHKPEVSLQYGQTLDVKYCYLREDIPHEKQLFDSLSVKITKEIVSLNESPITETSTADVDVDKKQHGNKTKKKRKNKNKGERYQQIMEEDRLRREQLEMELKERQKQKQSENDIQRDDDVTQILEKQAMMNLDKFEPAVHLTPTEWNEHLLSYSKCNNDQQEDSQSSDAILIDARNIYESKIGYFSSENVPTLLTNTRKYSTITSVFNESIQHMAGKNVYMYCTGGVRCERASVYLQSLANSEAWPEGLERPKSIYQLEGGVQKYLEEYGKTLATIRDGQKKVEKSEDEETNEMKNPNENSNLDSHIIINKSVSKSKCLFKGKNFVFDPRRYDPVVGDVEQPVGRCIVCSCPFDDYDNNHAPCDNMEARCCRCRILVLVCNDCRLQKRVWGQDIAFDNTPPPFENDDDNKKQHATIIPDLFCGLKGEQCVNEGNCVDHYEIINS